MWYCSECGSRNESGDFCINCSSPRVFPANISGSGTRSDPYRFNSSPKSRTVPTVIKIALLLLGVFAAAVAVVFFIGMLQHNRAMQPEEILFEYDGDTVESIELSLEKNNASELTAILMPDSAEGEISWSCSDENVVSLIDKGDGSCILNLNSEGDAVITAVCGEISAEMEVCVISDIILLPKPEIQP